MTILLVGHLLVAPLLLFPIVWQASPIYSLPLILIPLAGLTLLLLPRIKGAWIGLMGPANMPAPVVQRIDEEIGRAMQQREVRDRMATSGLEPEHHGSAAMGAYVRRQSVAFAEAIRRANIRIEG